MSDCCSLPAGGEVAWSSAVTTTKERKTMTGEVLGKRSGSRESETLPWLGVKDMWPAPLREQCKPGSPHPGEKLSFPLCPGKEGVNQA